MNFTGSSNTFENEQPILFLEEEIKINMTSKFRIIGLTFETRLNFITWSGVRNILNMG